MLTSLANTAFVVLTVFAIGFQLALAVGAPWGHLAWGGRFEGKLPGGVRAMSALSAVLLAVFAMIVATRAGVVLPGWHDASRSAVWAVVAYCALGVVANAATPSRWERIVWLPVVTLMLVTSAYVAIS